MASGLFCFPSGLHQVQWRVKRPFTQPSPHDIVIAFSDAIVTIYALNLTLLAASARVFVDKPPMIKANEFSVHVTTSALQTHGPSLDLVQLSALEDLFILLRV